MNTMELEELLFFEDADTLCFIDPPAYKSTFAVQPLTLQTIGHRLRSWKLLETGSPIIKHQFEPKTQERNIRRRGGLHGGIKYIIDLSPALTDEDAVLILTELSCPSGILTWAGSQKRWSLPSALVSGTDILEDGEEQGSGLAEYSGARHRAGIIQVLRVIEGLDPKLDTPCKFWTFFAVAKLYEIATMPEFNVRVASWIYDDNNRKFIELHPEITYRIAKGIQCPHMMQDTFCVLAGEEALSLLRNSGAPTPRQQQLTVHGRPQDSLDDDDVQRVQYAGESFLGYMLDQFVELAGTEMNWMNQSSMFQLVQTVRSHPSLGPATRIIVDNLITSLKDFVRASIIVTLLQPSATRLTNLKKLEPTDQYPTDTFWNTFGSMTPVQRIMSRTFWLNLHDRALSLGYTTNAFREPYPPNLASLGGYMGAFRGQENAIIRCVDATELEINAFEFNRYVLYDLHPDAAMRRYISRNGNPVCDFVGAFQVLDFIPNAQHYVFHFAREMMARDRLDIRYELTDSLTCLTDAQFRYLPLWAGGCDDGTGGVFADQVPFAETNGFSAPGPLIHTGSAAPSEAPSLPSLLESTIHGASHRATEGISSDIMSVDSEDISEADSSDFQKVDNELSSALDSSADGMDDFSFDMEGESDSDDTVVVETGELGDLSEFEELDLNNEEDTGREMNLPIREKAIA